jgi:hypothetical protein
MYNRLIPFLVDNSVLTEAKMALGKINQLTHQAKLLLKVCRMS